MLKRKLFQIFFMGALLEGIGIVFVKNEIIAYEREDAKHIALSSIRWHNSLRNSFLEETRGLRRNAGFTLEPSVMPTMPSSKICIIL